MAGRQIFEVRVLCGVNLKDTNTFTKQNPYVKLQYGGKVHCTVPDKGGGVNPSFKEKFEFKVVEGLEKIEVSVYNERTLGKTVHIGTGKIYMKEILDVISLKGSLEKTCLIYNEKVAAGEIRLMLTCPDTNRPDPYVASSSAHQPYYGPRATPSRQYHGHY